MLGPVGRMPHDVRRDLNPLSVERPRVIPDDLVARLEAYEGRPLRD